MAYVDSQNTAAAIGLLKEVAAAEPENGNVRFPLGSALPGRATAAPPSGCWNRPPEAAETYYILAECLKKLSRTADAEAGDLEGAIADYRASLEQSNDAAVAIDLAVALLKKREAREVIRLLEQDSSPLAAKPDFAEAWYQFGVILLPGDPAGAERALASAARLRPDEASMRLAWAEALDKSGQPTEAKRQKVLAARLRMLN